MTILENDENYGAFERILEATVDRTATRCLPNGVMPNHWNLVVWPGQDGWGTAHRRSVARSSARLGRGLPPQGRPNSQENRS